MTTTQPPPATKENALHLINLSFPERAGYIRKIHPIAESHFRINFHLIDGGNVVQKSHFIHIHDDCLTELN